MPAADWRTSSRRRWTMPVVILLIGGALAWWGSARETARMRSIEDQVQAIIKGVGDGKDLVGALNPANSVVESRTLDRLRQLIPSSKAAEIIRARVTPGDSAAERAGSSATQATHTVILHVGEDELIALRVQCDDPMQPMTVLGFVEIAQP